MKKTPVLAAAVAAAVIILSGCADEPAQEPEPTSSATPEPLTQEEIDSYREKLAGATDKTIASIAMSAPSPELRAEADAKMQELRTAE